MAGMKYEMAVKHMSSANYCHIGYTIFRWL